MMQSSLDLLVSLAHGIWNIVLARMFVKVRTICRIVSIVTCCSKWAKKSIGQ